MRRPAPSLLVVFTILALAQGASAATAPKLGSIYRDGPSGRYLLDGNWYERPDPADQGAKQGFQTSASTASWRVTQVPVAINAGDFSLQSYTGIVHWYRKDFKVPRAGPEADSTGR